MLQHRRFLDSARGPSATEPLEQAFVPWLLACVLATGSPHAEHLPPWLTLLAGILVALRAWLWRQNRPLPARWQLVSLVITASAGIYLQYGTLFGRDPGVALLVLFIALKPLETRDRRDAIVIVMLGFFLLMTHYFHSQGIPTGLWLMAATLLQTATLLRLYGGPQTIPSIARYAAILLLQASPFMLVLFLLFPRVNGPLWGLPQDAHGSKSGLPETITPGAISDLALNGAVAFRARFQGMPPENAKLYWRGPVLDEFDGRNWRVARLGRTKRTEIDARGSVFDYEITLEPHNQRWLLALDAPLATPEKTFVNARMQALAFEPVRQRSRFSFRSALDYRANIEESNQVLATAQQLPDTGNPRARALAAEWRAQHQDAAVIVTEALRMFRQQAFVYTLRPPLLGEHSVDEFIFDSRKGFCEHYATAFVFLMRAAGIPARVVAGYQGGEMNPVDGYLVVRQSDAHAWAEVWLEGQGWQRIDPTAAIAPSRVERGLASALSGDAALPVMMRFDVRLLQTLRFRWEAINNAWNQWVLGYNPERQRDMLTRMGLEEFDWRGMAAMLAALCAVMLIAVAALALRPRTGIDPAQRIWLRFCRKMARHGLPRPLWEGPSAFAARVAESRPELSAIVREAADAYAEARYGQKNGEALERLRSATRKLPQRWSLV